MRNSPPIPEPEKRRLRVYAFDPLASHAPNSILGSAAENEVTLEIAYEELAPGPVGQRVAVIDYDATSRKQYTPVDLDDPVLLAQDGLAPTEGDPRFHQQMVYAVAMKTIENFDRALGRRIRFTNRPRGSSFKGTGERLCIVPHAFREANAYFEPEANAVLFGYFTADAVPGSPFVPNQSVFTCLSADVVAHEVTHGLVHRLRPAFMEDTNDDVGGFHEGFSDIVAIFQHFTYPDLLRRVIARTGGALDHPGLFVDLAQQFGRATSGDTALRCAIMQADPDMYARTTEPHDRGAILVAAVFEAFFQSYRQRTADLLPSREGGTLSPGAVQRIAADAETTAQQFLTMCIRAFEFLPPVDIRFGDFLRAVITADSEINRSATRRNRELLIDGFRRRGIVPDDVFSLSEASLRWSPVDGDSGLPPIPTALVVDTVLAAHEIRRPRTSAAAPGFAAAMVNYGNAYPTELGLRHDLPVSVPSFHTSFHVGEDGQLRAQIVARFEQCDPAIQDGGAPMKGGTTLVAAADGRVLYAIAKPLPGVERADMKASGEQRRDRARMSAARRDDMDGMLPWMNDAEYAERGARRLSIERLHASAGGR